MKPVVRFFNKLSVRIITSIVLLVTVLNVLTGAFAFQAFTQTMIKEATSFADEIADILLSSRRFSLKKSNNMMVIL